MLTAEISSVNRDRCVQRNGTAFLRKGDSFIRGFFAPLPRQPLGEFKLHDGRDNSVRARRKFRRKG